MLTFTRVEGCNTFCANDGSGWTISITPMVFNCPPDKPAPTSLDCTLIGHICLVKGKTERVSCKELTLLKSYVCGNREQASRAGWTSSVRYHVYERRGDFSRPAIVIVQDCGSGPHFFIVDQLAFVESWKALAAAVDEPTAWDMLSALIGTYEKGHDEACKKYSTLFLQGRLKKRKRQGRYHVEILPAKGEPAGPEAGRVVTGLSPGNLVE